MPKQGPEFTSYFCLKRGVGAASGSLLTSELRLQCPAEKLSNSVFVIVFLILAMPYYRTKQPCDDLSSTVWLCSCSKMRTFATGVYESNSEPHDYVLAPLFRRQRVAMARQGGLSVKAYSNSAAAAIQICHTTPLVSRLALAFAQH